MYKIEFNNKELEAVTPQLACRLDELENLLQEAGENRDTKRVVELSVFIKTIRGFLNKMYNAQRI